MNNQWTNSRDEICIDFWRLLLSLRRWFAWILAGAVLCGLLAMAAAGLLDAPRYEAGLLLHVRNTVAPGETVSSGDVSASRELAESCVVLVKTRDAVTLVQACAGTAMDHNEFLKKFSAEAVAETELVRLTFSDSNAAGVKALAVAAAHVLPGYLEGVLRGASVSVTEMPELPREPVSRSRVETGLLGFGIGAVLLFGGAMAAGILDDRIRYSGDLHNFPWPLLAQLHTREDFASLAAKLRFSTAPCRILGIIQIGNSNGNGKALAPALGALEERVLLIDCCGDAAGEPGLWDYLSGREQPETLIRRHNRFHEITAGRREIDEGPLLCSRRMEHLVQRLTEHYDRVILNIPGDLPAGEFLVAARLCHGVLLMAEENHCTCRDLRKTAEDLESVQVKIIGSVFQEKVG